MISPIDPEAILLTGRVYDGNMSVIPDAMIELWQVDSRGQHWGRFGTGTLHENRFLFYIHAPEVLDGQAPFLSAILFMRGQLIHSYTRIYFEDFMSWNEQDPVYLSAQSRRSTLLAKKTATGYEFDIYMQGDNETVFFDV